MIVYQLFNISGLILEIKTGTNIFFYETPVKKIDSFSEKGMVFTGDAGSHWSHYTVIRNPVVKITDGSITDFLFGRFLK